MRLRAPMAPSPLDASAARLPLAFARAQKLGEIAGLIGRRALRQARFGRRAGKHDVSVVATPWAEQERGREAILLVAQCGIVSRQWLVEIDQQNLPLTARREAGGSLEQAEAETVGSGRDRAMSRAVGAGD